MTVSLCVILLCMTLTLFQALAYVSAGLFLG